MKASEYFKQSGYQQPIDKFDILTKKFDQLDMIDFASQYVEKVPLSFILDVKKQNQAQYKQNILSLLKSIDFNGVNFEDWELVLIRLEIDRLKQLSWIPKSLHFNCTNDF
jgi:hypothetical protein